MYKPAYHEISRTENAFPGLLKFQRAQVGHPLFISSLLHNYILSFSFQLLLTYIRPNLYRLTVVYNISSGSLNNIRTGFIKLHTNFSTVAFLYNHAAWQPSLMRGSIKSGTTGESNIFLKLSNESRYIGSWLFFAIKTS